MKALKDKTLRELIGRIKQLCYGGPEQESGQCMDEIEYRLDEIEAALSIVNRLREEDKRTKRFGVGHDA